jgi:hypothetical protein
MANKYVIHFEIDNVSSAVALDAADKAWNAIARVVGDANFDSAAERRDKNGTNPRAPRWAGWTDDAIVNYRRYPNV